MVREGRVFTRTGARPSFGIAYYVTAYEVGAQVTEASSGLTATVAAGHGFEADDKVMVGTDITQYRIVDSVTATTITFTETISLAEDNLLVNLADDTGSIQPNFDGNGLAVYTDMDYQNQAITNSVLSDGYGRYRYFHKGIAIWELVRDSNGTPFAIYLDAAVPADEDQVSYGVRYAHLFADGGTGTEDDPWTLTGSNPVQAAFDDLPDTGGRVKAIEGHFDIGSDDHAVSIPLLTSGADYRSYALEGAGRDLTFFHYSGTGTAVSYPQVNTGVAGSSYQSNQLILRGFAVQQRGTARTGIAIGATYVSESLFEDLVVGNRRQDRGSGEVDYGFEYGIRIATDDIGDGEVSDFNRFHRIYGLGNTVGMYVQNQGDNTVISECSFEPRQDVDEAQDGIEIHSSAAVKVTSCHLNFFNYDSDSFGLKLSGYIKGAQISANYIEGCSIGVWVYSDQDHNGVGIFANSISFNEVTSSIGIRAGLDSSAFELKGLNIANNGFFVLSATNTAIRIADNVKGFLIGPNGYDNTGGTDRTLQIGCRGVVIESFDETNFLPGIQLIDSGTSVGQILLDNQIASSAISPRIQFSAGNSAPHGVGSFNAYLGVSAGGVFQIQESDGNARFSVDQDGNTTTVGTMRRSVSAAVTASTTQTQVGGTALTSDINNVSVCANSNDTVTLPTAVAGMTITILNNGAQTLKIYPASGDNLGAGVDASTTLVAGSNIVFVSFDATNWETI